MERRVQQADKSRHNLESKVCYYRKKQVTLPSLSQSKILQLQEVSFWQNRCTELEEEVEGFLREDDVKTFHGGCYSDAVREVYLDLMCLRVGSRNVERIVRLVLQKMTGKDVGRLPGPSFAKYMLLEARSLAYQHLRDELEGEPGELTVGLDGTTKFGHHYGSAALSFQNRQTMVMGLRDMATGDSAAYLNILKDLLQEAASYTDTDSQQCLNTTLARMKNTISDQASVNKKLNDLFQVWRAEALPHVVDGWTEMTEEVRNRYITVNNFWCGLHFLVGLSEQANKTLRVWEQLLHGDRPVGAPGLPGGYSKTGEAGSTRLVRTVCKALQDRGCEKSGKPVEFRDFLRQEGTVKDVPLVPFKGNRFNVLFHNAAGLFYLLQDVMTFTSRQRDSNNLFKAIHADVRITSFQAGVRALGLISLLVTEPLWREIARDGHVSAMTPAYQLLVTFFEVNFKKRKKE